MNLDYYHVGPTFQRAGRLVGLWLLHGERAADALCRRRGAADRQLAAEHAPGRRAGDRDAVGRQFRRVDAGGSCRDRQRRVDPAGGGRCAYAALCVQCHFDPFAVPGPWTAGAERYLAGVLASGRENGLPIVAGAHWLSFTQARAGAQLAAYQVDAASGALTFTIHTTAPDAGLTLLLPVRNNVQRLAALQANGKEISFQTRKVGATLYAVAPLDAPKTVVEARYTKT
jgi:hypothetical protein